MIRDPFLTSPTTPIITPVPDTVAQFLRRLDREDSPDILDLILVAMWIDGWSHERLAEITYAAPPAMLSRIQRACEHVVEPLYIVEIPTPSKPWHPRLSKRDLNELAELQEQAQKARRQTRHDHPARRARRRLAYLYAHHLSRGIDLDTLARVTRVSPQEIWKRLPLGYRNLLTPEPRIDAAPYLLQPPTTET